MEPVSYLRSQRVRGYTRKDGKKVKGYRREYWIVQFEEDLETLDIKGFGHEEYDPAALPEQKALRPKPAPEEGSQIGDEWIPVSERLAELYEAYDYFEVQDGIHRAKDDDPYISSYDGLVFDEPIEERSLKALGYSEGAVVSAWVLLYNTNRDVYFVFARTRSLIPATRAEISKGRLQTEVYSAAEEAALAQNRRSLRGLYQEALNLYQSIVDWATEETDYIEVRELIAWTFWGVPIGHKREDREFAPRKYAEAA